jgi:Zn-finger nucleic acid-binding protein
MMRRYFSPRTQIEIDECPGCGGIWLDAEELEGIRSIFKGAAERQAAKRAFADAVMSSPEAAAQRREAEQFTQKIDGLSATLWGILGRKRGK